MRMDRSLSRNLQQRSHREQSLDTGSATRATSRHRVLTAVLITVSLGTYSGNSLAQQIVLQNSGQNFSEPYAFTFNSLGVPETIATSNSTTGGTFWYGCTRDNYVSWQNWNLGFTGDSGDTSGFDAIGEGTAVIVSSQTSLNGPRWYWSTEPCPASGPPHWQVWNFNTDTTGSVDYPHSAYDPSFGQLGITFSQVISGQRRMVVGRIPSSFEGLTWFWSGCTNIASDFVNLINSAFDYNGDQHLVYADYTTGQIRHEVYSRTGGFQCKNNVIGSFSTPAGSGCGCSANYQGLTSPCIRANPSPSITWNFGTNNLVVTYSTPGSGSCSTTSEQRMYLSTDLGNTWSFRAVTGCQNSFFTRVASNPNASANIHIMSTYALGGTNQQVAQANWTSTDHGSSWSGGTTTSFQNINPIFGCYAGDYQGAVYDWANTKVFNAWGGATFSNFVIDGITVSP